MLGINSTSEAPSSFASTFDISLGIGNEREDVEEPAKVVRKCPCDAEAKYVARNTIDIIRCHEAHMQLPLRTPRM